jgi:hypothetical protein
MEPVMRSDTFRDDPELQVSERPIKKGDPSWLCNAGIAQKKMAATIFSLCDLNSFGA